MFSIIPANQIQHEVYVTLSNPRLTAFTRYEGTRMANLTIAAPAKAIACLQNTLKAPFQCVGIPFNAAARIIYHLTGIETMRKLGDKLPRFADLLGTIAKIFNFAVGTVLSATLGVCCPEANHKLNLKLISNLETVLNKLHYIPRAKDSALGVV